MKSMIVLLITMVTCSVYGADEAENKVVDEFFKVAKVKEKYEMGMMIGYDAATKGQDLSALPEEQIAKIQNVHKRIKAFMLKEMSWDTAKSAFRDLYKATYTQEEMKELIEFFKTPLGKKLVEKELTIMPKAAQISTAKAMELAPRIREIAIEEMSK